MGLVRQWWPQLWAWAGKPHAASPVPALHAGLARLRRGRGGQGIDGRCLQPLLAPTLADEAVARGRGSVVWYCLGPHTQGYRATAQCRRTWRGWQVGWHLQALDAQQLQQALAAEPSICERVFGRLRGQRLYA